MAPTTEGLAQRATRGPAASSLCFGAALVVLAVAYLACLDEVAGLFVDDAWYIVLARALATGHGFTLINAPVENVLPFYPPGYPALLALVMLVAPDFPANVVLLKLVSVVPLLVAAVLLRHYFVRCRGESSWVASGLALLVVVDPFMHFLLTSAVLSEGLFLCVQTAAILAIERCVRRDPPSRGRAAVDLLIAATLVAATILVRSIGATLVPAAVLYALLRGGLRKSLLLATAIVCLLAPWQIYAAAHAPTEQQRAIVNDSIAWPYTEQFTMKRAGRVESGRETIADLPARVARNLRRLSRETMGTLYANPLLQGAPYARAVSRAAALLTLLGLVLAIRRQLTVVELYVPATLGLLLVFGFAADRYLLPLLPFLACYALIGCASIVGTALATLRISAGRAARHARHARTALLATLLLVNAFGLVRDVADTLGMAPRGRTGWRRGFAENLELLAWVRANLPRDVVLATHNPAMVFLYTGNPTVGSWEGSTNGANWRTARARFWVDSTIASYRFPNMRRSGLVPLVETDQLDLGVYRIPPPGFELR